MTQTLQEYYLNTMPELHFALVPECSGDGDRFYRMLPGYGKGSLRQICFNDMFIVLIADYRPRESFERVSEISQSYLEISQFETNSSYYRIGGRKMEPVGKGLCCYINRSKRVYVHCKAGAPVRFTKVIILKEYYDAFLEKRYGDSYTEAEQVMGFLSRNPNMPELNLIFQQIRRCRAAGKAQQIYMEGKILELLSLAVCNYEEAEKRNPVPVRLDKKDLRGLRCVTDYMESHLSEYPSIGDLAGIANMSTTRFQMAFRKTYGTTAYGYLKDLRMNRALLLLQDSEYSVQHVAQAVGYGNAGHFAGVFRKIYGITPGQYRRVQEIK